MTRFASKMMLVALATLAVSQVAEAQQRQWYFGMNVRLTYRYRTAFLEVVSVNPYGPARAAGLEPGDAIYSVNNMTFDQARTDSQAVDILQYATGNGGNAGGQPTTLVVTQPGVARMQVIDARTGQYTPVVCYPRNNFGGGGGGIPTGIPQQNIGGPGNGGPSYGGPNGGMPSDQPWWQQKIRDQFGNHNGNGHCNPDPYCTYPLPGGGGGVPTNVTTPPGNTQPGGSGSLPTAIQSGLNQLFGGR